MLWRPGNGSKKSPPEQRQIHSMAGNYHLCGRKDPRLIFYKK